MLDVVQVARAASAAEKPSSSLLDRFSRKNDKLVQLLEQFGSGSRMCSKATVDAEIEMPKTAAAEVRGAAGAAAAEAKHVIENQKNALEVEMLKAALAEAMKANQEQAKEVDALQKELSASAVETAKAFEVLKAALAEAEKIIDDQKTALAEAKKAAAEQQKALDDATSLAAEHTVRLLAVEHELVAERQAKQ